MERMTVRNRFASLNLHTSVQRVPCGISPDFSGLSPCCGLVPYALLTRAPVAGKGIATSPLPLDLHVLGLSLAFILSQDQTLRCIFFILYYTFEALPDRIDFFLSSFPVLHLLLQFPQ